MHPRDIGAFAEWRRIADLRDFLAHGYHEIDDDIIWNVVRNHLPSLKTRIMKIISKQVIGRVKNKKPQGRTNRLGVYLPSLKGEFIFS
ncbi:DUF86 domain-containing protein [Leptospira wolffii]|uniref:DUF86 domain-containing protein n=1 Tax=Leptospira wolffii TaxID=409998 RepID=A0ABV5BJX6_9LEPT